MKDDEVNVDADAAFLASGTLSWRWRRGIGNVRDLRRGGPNDDEESRESE